jgi:hypothetical protein
MASIHDFRNNRFLSKYDCDPSIKATVDRVLKENVAPDGEPQALKGVMHFKEPDIKPLVLNWTNLKALARLLGTEETGEWAGAEITLFHDPDVAGPSGQRGGIRVQNAAPALGETQKLSLA